MPSLPRTTRFLLKALGAGATVLLTLAVGMAFTIRAFERVSTAQVARVRMAERKVTDVERLRWSGELIVSRGRGYALSGDPSLLAKLDNADAAFDRGVHDLRHAATPIESQLVIEVERGARTFQEHQQALLVALSQQHQQRRDASRIDTELAPLRQQFRELLSRLVDAQQVELGRMYHQAAIERGHLAARLYTLLAALVMMGVAVTWFFAVRLARAYHNEYDARRTAHRALAARDELMGIVAHDLRNPLGAITMQAALLRRSSESEKTRRQAEAIEHVTTRMEYLVESMLDVATMEAGRFSVSPAAFDVADLVRESAEMFESLSASKQIRLERPAVEAGLTVNADRERILQLLSNLLGNAFKFTPEGGSVTLAAARHRDMVLFSVSDTGPGIASEHVAHVFERYWKYETDGKQGTGLGLFIVKGIIDAHRERIWVESTPGHGATFHFTLHLAQPVGATAPVNQPAILVSDKGFSARDW
jgi:signal transduction histidine kinase